MIADLENLLAFLRTKPLQYMVHLKHLHLYPDDMQVLYTDSADGIGVLLSYEPTLTSWDHSLYPTTSRIFLPTATTPNMAQQLCEQVKSQAGDRPFVCKFCDSETRDVFAQNFRLQHAKTYISYTTKQLEIDDPLSDVVVSDSLDESVAAFYVANGYDHAELLTLFSESGLSFTIYQDDEPICTCFIYQNFDNIWEIGGVRTIEQARHRGYARRVVFAALRTLLARGWIPRYQAEATNTASIRLAASLGLTPCLRFEHYIGEPLA